MKSGLKMKQWCVVEVDEKAGGRAGRLAGSVRGLI